MTEVLVTAGVACVIIAVAGGRASAFGVRFSEIVTIRRQVMLVVVGLVFLVAGVALGRGGDSDGDSADVKAYRQAAQSTCAVISRAQSPPRNPDDSYDRETVLIWFNGTLIASWRGVLDELWKRPVPAGLRDDQRRAHQSADAYLEDVAQVGNQLAVALPSSLTEAQLRTFLGELFARIAPSSGNLEATCTSSPTSRAFAPNERARPTAQAAPRAHREGHKWGQSPDMSASRMASSDMAVSDMSLPQRQGHVSLVQKPRIRGWRIVSRTGWFPQDRTAAGTPATDEFRGARWSSGGYPAKTGGRPWASSS